MPWQGALATPWVRLLLVCKIIICNTNIITSLPVIITAVLNHTTINHHYIGVLAGNKLSEWAVMASALKSHRSYCTAGIIIWVIIDLGYVDGHLTQSLHTRCELWKLSFISLPFEYIIAVLILQWFTEVNNLFVFSFV